MRLRAPADPLTVAGRDRRAARSVCPGLRVAAVPRADIHPPVNAAAFLGPALAARHMAEVARSTIVDPAGSPQATAGHTAAHRLIMAAARMDAPPRATAAVVIADPRLPMVAAVDTPAAPPRLTAAAVAERMVEEGAAHRHTAVVGASAVVVRQVVVVLGEAALPVEEAVAPPMAVAEAVRTAAEVTEDAAKRFVAGKTRRSSGRRFLSALPPRVAFS